MLKVNTEDFVESKHQNQIGKVTVFDLFEYSDAVGLIIFGVLMVNLWDTGPSGRGTGNEWDTGL